MPEFNDWFPSSRHGTNTLNVMDFGAFADGGAHVLSGTYGTLVEAQADYPSAVSLSDTADWAAITECFKQAFQHETSPGVWESNGTAYWLNKPVFFPAGLYTIYKPLHWDNIQGGWIFGSGGGTKITNELGTPGQSSCVLTNGFAYCRVENITFSTVGGELASKGFDLNSDNGVATTVAANACTFHSCHFTAPGGCGIALADPATFPGAGYMSSEVHFYHCTMNNSAVGIYVANWNALNYSFVGCGGIFCDTWLQVSAGGTVTVVNGSLAANDLDINVGAGTASIISTRSESEKFVYASGPTSIINCIHSGQGSESVFCTAQNSTYMFGCWSTMGRITGDGSVHLEECTFNQGGFAILTAAASPTAPLIRLTHDDPNPTAYELWLDGDQIEIVGVTGTGAASINGVWIISKINRTTIDLVGSTFGGTYTLGAAQIKPGPRFHLRNNVTAPGTTSKVRVSSIPVRSVQENVTASFTEVLWADSGKVFTNDGATGNVTIQLPGFMSGYVPFSGTHYTFIVLAAHTVTIQINSEWAGASFGPSPRLVKLGGTVGTNISNTGVIGASVEIYLVEDNVSTATVTTHASRWLVRSEAGTWTLAGTPAS